MPKSSPARKGSAKKAKPNLQKPVVRSKSARAISKNKKQAISEKFNKNLGVKSRSTATPKRAQLVRAQLKKVEQPRGSRAAGGQPKNLTRKLLLPVRVVRSASVKQYETAMKLLYSHDYEKARTAFEKTINLFADDKEILERARIHLKLCEQKIARKPLAPRTLDEHYDLAVALMNEGNYGEALEHLNRALKSNPKCDYVIYALAAMNSRTGNLETALNNLQTAITLKPTNRFLAQRDADFEPLKQDVRFISMVFPERLPLAT